MAKTHRPKIMDSYIHVKIPKNEKKDFISKVEKTPGASISIIVRQLIKEWLNRS